MTCGIIAVALVVSLLLTDPIPLSSHLGHFADCILDVLSPLDGAVLGFFSSLNLIFLLIFRFVTPLFPIIKSLLKAL